jgi:MoaA/NifB/PqqE/SkfB family radical SAM enzyme
VATSARGLPVVQPVASPAAKPSVFKPTGAAMTDTLGMVFVTRRCNLDCSYCHMAHEGIEDTPLPVIHKAIDLLLDYSKHTTFHWFGGEPLLRFDLIEAALAYIAERSTPQHRSRHLITTNALLLHRHFDWLKEHGFDFMLSVDGTLESQSSYRKAFGNDQRGPYDKIFAAIRMLNDAGSDYFVNMCVSPGNVDQMFENARHLKHEGVKRVQVSYELGALWEADGRRRYLAGLRRIIEELHDAKSYRVQDSPHGEPVLASLYFTFDCNGDVFNGPAVVLEKTLPAYNEAGRVGHVSSLKSLEGLERTRFEQVTYYMRETRSHPYSWDRLRSCMHLGYRVRTMLIEMRHNV